ncbi:MAG: hypothetical protein KAT34_12475 [Candidatus Aminicenantes bacterium]|nr:hypothetical protein [Candidatus Aminicenantes bacterium]
MGKRETEKRAALFIFFICLMVLVAHFQALYDDKIDYFSEQNTFIILPPGKTLRLLSFGYRNLAADMLFIWSIQFYSSYYLSNRYDYIEHIYNTITDITPQYTDPYIVGSWIMALEAKDYKMAIRLLQKGSENNKDQYIFDYEAGYYAFENLKDYELAEQLFQKAAKRPNAPAVIKRSWAHLVYMKDDLDFAWNLWADIYKNSKMRVEKDAAFNHLYQIKYEVDRKYLEAKIQLYKKKYGRYPQELEDLKRIGLVTEVPGDFRGSKYIYNPVTGKLKAKLVFKWKKKSS